MLMSSWRLLICCLFSLVLAGPQLLAADSTPNPNFTLARTARQQTTFFVDSFLGVLQVDESGLAIVNRVGVNYAMPNHSKNPRYSVHFDFFMSGWLSDENTEYGPGNARVGGEARLWDHPNHNLVVGLEAQFPFAQDEANFGLATPFFSGFFEDAWGFMPATYYAYERDRWSFVASVGLDLLLLTDQPDPLDVAELFVNYSAGVAYDLGFQLQPSVEMLGITDLFPADADTQLWVGPGVVWDPGGRHYFKVNAAISMFEQSKSTLQPLIGLAWFFMI